MGYLESLDWGDVVRKFDCSVQHPIDVNIYFVLFLIILCATGFSP